MRTLLILAITASLAACGPSGNGNRAPHGGMLAATFLAIFFVPLFFKLFTDRHLTEERGTEEIKGEAAQARSVSHRPVPAPHHAPHPVEGGPPHDSRSGA